METVPSIRTRAPTTALLLLVLPVLGHRAAAQDSVRVAPRTEVAGAFTAGGDDFIWNVSARYAFRSHGSSARESARSSRR